MKKLLRDISIKAPVNNPFKIIEEYGKPMPPSLIPGHLYALGIDTGSQVSPDTIPYDKQDYVDNKDDKFFVTKKPYYDSMPFGIALNINNENYQSILNLKLMSPVYRRLILDSYYAIMNVKNNFISPYVSEDLKTIDTPIGKRIRDQSYMQPFFAVNESFISKIVNANVNFAIKNYEINSIKKVRLLDWNALPDIYNMGVASDGIIFNQRIGGIEGIFERFESKFF
jgi:hypothetical protein